MQLPVINSNLHHILHRFRDIAFERSKIAIFGHPSCVYPSSPTERHHGTISVKILPDYQLSRDGQGTIWRRNIAENFNRLSRVHERHRQTDLRRHISCVNVSSRSSMIWQRFAVKQLIFNLSSKISRLHGHTKQVDNMYRSVAVIETLVVIFFS